MEIMFSIIIFKSSSSFHRLFYTCQVSVVVTTLSTVLLRDVQ